MPEPAETSQRTPAVYVVGEVVNDRYEVLAILGSGAFSTVYRVFDSARGHECAMKVFGPNFGLDVAQRELRALMNLRHPNVVEVIDVGQTSTHPALWFLKSEYVDGQLLSDFTEPGGQRLALADVLAAADQILDALQVIHPQTARIEELKSQSELAEADYLELMELQASGLIHRDIKPQNIIRSADGTMKLLDFNIATPAGAAVLTTSGTPAYTPPEANLAAWDVSPDLFAVGVILYELLTLQHPYPDRQARPDVEPRSPSELNPDLPLAVGEVVCRMCGPRREERYSSALEARRALAAAVTADTSARGEDLADPADFVAAVIDAGRSAGQDVELAAVGPGVWSLVASPEGYAIELHVLSGALAVELVVASSEALRRLREQHEQLAVLGLEPTRTPSGARWLFPVGDSPAASVELTVEVLAGVLVLSVEIVERGAVDETIPTLAIGGLPEGHIHLGWINTPDIRLPFVVADLPSEDGFALSAMTASGVRRYPAPRGAYLWDEKGRAFPYESIATAKWIVGRDSAPASDADDEGLTFVWRAPIEGLAGVSLLEVVVENRDGSAFVRVMGQADRQEPPAADDAVQPLGDTVIGRFVESRLPSDDDAAHVMRAFVADASGLGLDWELGKSSSSQDGYGAYAIMRIGELGANGQVAFLWPASGRLDLRLDRDWARGRPFASQRKSARANAFQVQVDLRSEPARREAIELLTTAIDQVSGSRV